jgi:hypothetical protein
MHILGLGDYEVEKVESMDDPCPVLANKKDMNKE